MSSLVGDGHENNVKAIWLPLPLAKRDKDRNAASAQRHPRGTKKSWGAGMLQTPLLAVPAPILPDPLAAPQNCCKAAKLEEGPIQGLLKFLAKQLHAQARQYFSPA